MADLQADLDIHAENFITSLLQLVVLMLAGQACLTIANLASGKRYAFRFKVKHERTKKGGYKALHGVGPWYVEVRGQYDWEFLGVLVAVDGVLVLRPSARSTYGSDGEHFQAASYLVKLATQGRRIPEAIRIWNAGECCRCGRELISEFRHLGIGPVCSGLSVSKIMKARSDSERVELLRDVIYEGKLHTPTMAAILRLMPEGVARDYAQSHLRCHAA